jgi:GT2 family glycosyltransferase
MNNIAAIVVTYNRKNDLICCLDAIRSQSVIPDIIYIIDNHSTDGTSLALKDNKLIEELPDFNSPTTDQVFSSQINAIKIFNKVISIVYVYKANNTGGSGGFYTGMKMAFDDGYEWLWMMDDDGIPAEDSLEHLYFYSNKVNLNFTNSLVINKDDRISLSFSLEKGKDVINDYIERDVLYDKISPFNGTFVNRVIPAKIGFVKKEMFIYGDETEYVFRANKAGYRTGTIIKSIHYHPSSKNPNANIFPFLIKKYKITLIKRNYARIYYRNYGYIYYVYNKIALCTFALRYIIYFTLHFKFIECRDFIVAIINGCKGKFDNTIETTKKR